jgi:hypothetical protein
MPYHFKYVRLLHLRVHAESQEAAEEAVQATLRYAPGTFQPSPWTLGAAVEIEPGEVEVLPSDFVVRGGRVVRADTIDTRTLPMPWGKK